MRAETGNQLSLQQRLALKRRLLSQGWFQNEHGRWEHPFYRNRTGRRGYTLINAGRKQGFVLER